MFLIGELNRPIVSEESYNFPSTITSRASQDISLVESPSHWHIRSNTQSSSVSLAHTQYRDQFSSSQLPQLDSYNSINEDSQDTNSASSLLVRPHSIGANAHPSSTLLLDAFTRPSTTHSKPPRSLSLPPLNHSVSSNSLNEQSLTISPFDRHALSSSTILGESQSHSSLHVESKAMNEALEFNQNRDSLVSHTWDQWIRMTNSSEQDADFHISNFELTLPTETHSKIEEKSTQPSKHDKHTTTSVFQTKSDMFPKVEPSRQSLKQLQDRLLSKFERKSRNDRRKADQKSKPAKDDQNVAQADSFIHVRKPSTVQDKNALESTTESVLSLGDTVAQSYVEFDQEKSLQMTKESEDVISESGSVQSKSESLRGRRRSKSKKRGKSPNNSTRVVSEVSEIQDGWQLFYNLQMLSDSWKGEHSLRATVDATSPPLLMTRSITDASISTPIAQTIHLVVLVDIFQSFSVIENALMPLLSRYRTFVQCTIVALPGYPTTAMGVPEKDKLITLAVLLRSLSHESKQKMMILAFGWSCKFVLSLLNEESFSKMGITIDFNPLNVITTVFLVNPWSGGNKNFTQKTKKVIRQCSLIRLLADAYFYF